MCFWRFDLRPLALAQCLVDKQVILRAGANDNGTILSTVRRPDDIWRGSGLGTARHNQPLMLGKGKILRVRRDAIAEREGVG